MIDEFTKKPVRVSTDGASGPYIVIPEAQLESLTKVLDEGRVQYDVDEEAISINDGPFTAVVNLGSGADAALVQRLLDAHNEPISRRRPSVGRHG